MRGPTFPGGALWCPSPPVVMLGAIWGRSAGWLLLSVTAALLIATVLVAVHHAEVIALRVGEPYGTLVLASGGHRHRRLVDRVHDAVRRRGHRSRWRETPCMQP